MHLAVGQSTFKKNHQNLIAVMFTLGRVQASSTDRLLLIHLLPSIDLARRLPRHGHRAPSTNAGSCEMASGEVSSNLGQDLSVPVGAFHPFFSCISCSICFPALHWSAETAERSECRRNILNLPTPSGLRSYLVIVELQGLLVRD